jgi:hypothetical protein
MHLPAAPHNPTARHQHEQQHQLPSLPDAVLTTILQHVPLRDRLSACTLVCKSWAVAVASTTADVLESIKRPDSCRHMQDWLQLWGEQVSSIDLMYGTDYGEEDTVGDGEAANPFQCRLLLPCSNLTRLTHLALGCFPLAFHTQQHASGVSTRSRQRASTAQSLAASSGMRGTAPAGAIHAAAAAGGGAASFLPALQDLLLFDCQVRADSFLQLSQLTGLTSLHLNRVVLCTAAWAPVAAQQASKAFSAVLQQLHCPGLETLILADHIVLQESDAAAALSALSTMQRLHYLDLSTEVCRTAAHLAHFPTGLTRLKLRGVEEDQGSSLGFLRVTASALPQLPLLRAAELDWVELGPGVLACWSRCVRSSSLHQSCAFFTRPESF